MNPKRPLSAGYWRKLEMNWPHLLLAAILLGLLWLPRALALERYATVDEAKWMLRSGNFFQALSSGNLAQTYQSEHPGVTVTWAGMAGLIRTFRGYAGLSGEQMPGPTRFLRFLQGYDQNPASILAAGRLFMVLGIVGAHLLAFLAAARLTGWWPAWLGFALLALDPFPIALSRLLHLDGLSSALMLLALFWFLVYLYAGRKRYALLISAAGAGLSWLTKSPAVFLIPFLGGLALISYWQEQQQAGGLAPSLARLWQPGRPYLAWLLVAAAVFCLLWPAMWVDPLGTLQKVFGEALNYSLAGNQNAIFFDGRVYASGESAWYYYPVAWLWRTSPVILAGVVLAAVRPILRKLPPIPGEQVRLAGILALYALSFTALLSLAEQKYARYILPAMLALDLIAGLGWYWMLSYLWQTLARNKPGSLARVSLGLAAAALLGGQLWGVLLTYPYYLQYFNPLLGGLHGATKVMQIGWGEGLDQAARYLNSKPRPGQLRVISWYGDAPFGYYFKGTTINMPEDAALDDLLEADYVVLYYQQFQRQLPSPEILRYFQAHEPEYTVTLNGLEYAQVYRTAGLTLP